eukprot:2219093-Pleurochrysis_carterae.AAC.3
MLLAGVEARLPFSPSLQMMIEPFVMLLTTTGEIERAAARAARGPPCLTAAPMVDSVTIMHHYCSENGRYAAWLTGAGF